MAPGTQPGHFLSCVKGAIPAVFPIPPRWADVGVYIYIYIYPQNKSHGCLESEA